jgi:uncharacterized protein
MNRNVLYRRSIDGLRGCRWLMLAAAFLALSGFASIAASPAATAGGPTATASYTPLACGKAVSQSELAICRTYSLGQAEARMATLFGIATSLVAMGQRADTEESQRQWLNARDSCGSNTVCLSRSYQARIDTLLAIVASISARGPF